MTSADFSPVSGSELDSEPTCDISTGNITSISDVPIAVPIGVSEDPLSGDELELIRSFCDKVDSMLAEQSRLIKLLEEVRSLYASEYWLPKVEAAHQLNISSKRLRVWMDSGQFKEGVHFMDTTPPGSGSPRWVVNVPRARRAIQTAAALRSNRIAARQAGKKRGRKPNSVKLESHVQQNLNQELNQSLNQSQPDQSQSA